MRPKFIQNGRGLFGNFTVSLMGTSATVAFMLMDCVVLSARFTPSSTDHTQMLHACVNAYRGQFEHFLLKLIISCLVLLVFLTLFLFNFPSFMLNNCLYCVGCMVCYNVEELRSSYDAKLQHVFFSTFSSSVFLQNMSKLGLKMKKKFCGNKTSIRYTRWSTDQCCCTQCCWLLLSKIP